MSLAAALDAFIGEECREYRRELLEAEWDKVTHIRVGALDREPHGQPLGDNYLIKKPPPSIGTIPNEMTEDQRILAHRDLMAELDKVPDDDDDGYNPETGEQRRVDTSHDWERDT